MKVIRGEILSSTHAYEYGEINYTPLKPGDFIISNGVNVEYAATNRVIDLIRFSTHPYPFLSGVTLQYIL